LTFLPRLGAARDPLGWLSFFLTIAFVPDFAGAAQPPRWALLSAAVPAIIFASSFKGKKIIVTWGHVLGLCFLGWAFASLAWTADIYGGLDAAWKLILMAALFWLGSQAESLRPVLIGSALGFAINSALAIWQVYETGLDEGQRALGKMITQLVAPAGLFLNANFMAEAAVIVLVGLIGYRLWWLVPLVLPAAFLPMARGSLMALAVVGIAELWRWSRAMAIYGALALCLSGLMVYGLHNRSADHRLVIWTDTARGLTPLGNGIGSYYVHYGSHAPLSARSRMFSEHAHSDPLEIAYQFGIPGLILWGALLVWLLCGPLRPERMMLAVFAVEGLVGFPFFFPCTAFLAALAAGRLCRDRALVRDQLHGWRVFLRGRGEPEGLAARAR